MELAEPKKKQIGMVSANNPDVVEFPPLRIEPIVGARRYLCGNCYEDLLYIKEMQTVSRDMRLGSWGEGSQKYTRPRV